MSLDLYERESADRLSQLQPVRTPEPGAFDGFLRGTGMAAMRGFAKAGRAASMAVGGAVGLAEKMGEGHPLGGTNTEMSDAFFRVHDDVFQSAVDYWTPRPGEVGTAAEVVGGLVSMLPQVIASPALTVAAMQMAVSEDVSRKGVDTPKAVAAGAAQGAGLGVGIWMPILGKNLWQRVLLGGAGFNAVQGAAMRGASEVILKGTAAEGDFKAFDPEQLTLDVLLGMAFGGIAHLSPAQRAQGKAVWDRIEKWAGNLQPSDIDAIVTLRQSQHLNVDSAPGALVAPVDVEAHTGRLRAAIDQLAADRPVDVEGMPAPRVEAEPTRVQEMAQRARELTEIAERVRVEEGLPALAQTEPVAAPPTRIDGPPPVDTGEAARTAGTEDGARAADPMAMEAARIADENPDLQITVGQDADGAPVRRTAKQVVDDAAVARRLADADARLFEVAAECMLGVT